MEEQTTQTPQQTMAHPAHPVWNGFSWDKFLQGLERALQLAAVMAPAVAPAFTHDPQTLQQVQVTSAASAAALGEIEASQQAAAAEPAN